MQAVEDQTLPMQQPGRDHQGVLHCKQKGQAVYQVVKKMQQEAREDQQEGM